MHTIKKFSANSIKEFFLLVTSFFLWPFSSLVMSLLLYKKKWSRHLFVLFCFYFGYTFIIPVTGGDSEFYNSVLSDYFNSQISFKNFVEGLFTIETQQTDLYQPIVTWIVSRFTDNYHVLFAVFGLVFGIFYSKILWFIFDRINYKISGFAIVLFLMLLLINPIWNINGVRMWTALEVCVYGALLFFYKNKKGGIFYMILSVVFHISFFIPLVFFVLYMLLPKSKGNFLFYLYVGSILLSSLPLNFLNGIAEYFPDIIRFKLESYTDDNFASNAKEDFESSSYFIRLAIFSLNFSMIIIVFFVRFYFIKKVKDDFITLNFFNFIIFTLIWTNIFSMVPSGGRFLSFSYIILMSFVLINLTKIRLNNKFLYFKALILPLFGAFFVYNFRNFLDYQCFSLFFGNILTFNLFSEPESIIHYLK
ncbi:EpsG family protein [Flavobacterium chilense]|uniref:EpsG family protein n=1 Tax=Flavobacterium chilense TaxID=946677 RepID=A0A1M7GSG5_9FLAO|nr:EpsG family protein [Flavobacterium chilense]SHM19160.1 EpsG family protein [Flavobacterium chilense]